MVNNDCNAVTDPQALIANFPYNDLPNVSPTNLDQIRKCLPYLLQISQSELFYTNLKAVKYTCEFTTTMLATVDVVFVRDILVDLLILLKEILIRLTAHNQLENVFPDITKLFDLLLYVSDLDGFCKYCSNITQYILLELLKGIKNNYEIVDEALAGILKNFKKIQADTEVAIASEDILLRFPLEAKSYKLSAYWLMEDSIRMLKNVEYLQEESRISDIIKNIYIFFMKVSSSSDTHSELLTYQKFIVQFIKYLMGLSPKLIDLCCTNTIAPEAKQLLGLVLHEFLREQDITSEEIGMITRQEIEEFPVNVEDWPKCYCRTFFWLNHLLYYHKRSVWTTGAICDAMRQFLHTKHYKKIINVHILKSVCYVYPNTITGRPSISERRLTVGDVLLNILPTFLPLLHQILSISKSQLVWIMFKGSWKIKMATIKFWLTSSQENLPILKEVLLASKSEKCLIDIVLSAWDSKTPVVYKAVEVIQGLHSALLLKEMPLLIVRFSRNIEVVVPLIRACCLQIPQDKGAALKIFNSVYLILQTNPDDEVVTIACEYVSNLITELRMDEDFIKFVCSDQFWIRYPISRMRGGSDSMVISIVRLLTNILKYQNRPCYTQETIFINLLPLLTKSPEVVEETVAFLNQLLKIKTALALKKIHILTIMYKLCEIIDTSNKSTAVYDCLTGLLQLYPTELINSPVLGMLVEEKCQFLDRKSNSSSSVKFIRFWIKLMFANPLKKFCYLPREGALRSFIKRSIGLLESTVNRYSHFISEIYCNQDHDSYDEDELPRYFNLRTNIRHNLSIEL